MGWLQREINLSLSQPMLMQRLWMQASVTVTLATATDENVYTAHALEAHIAVKVDTVLGAGAGQDLKDNNSFLTLHVTTFQDHADGRQFEF